MTTTTTLKLPCGMWQTDKTWATEIEIRPMKGYEEDILADRRTEKRPGQKKVLLKKPSRRITEVLSRCTMRIGTERRPDDLDPKGERYATYFDKHWERAFSSDRSFGILKLREISVDPIFKFKGVCYRCETECDNLNVDLSTLKVTYMDQALAQKDTYLTVTSSGLKVEWRALRASDDDRMTEAAEDRKADPMSAALQLRLVSIDGDPPKIDAIREMSARDRKEIRQAYDKLEGGIDTTVFYTCTNPECGADLEMKVPVSDYGFFFPSETSSRSKPIFVSSQKHGTGPQISPLTSESTAAAE